MTGAATIMSPVHSRSNVPPPDGAAVPVHPCTTPPWPNQHMALTTEYPFSNDDSSHNLLNLQHQCTRGMWDLHLTLAGMASVAAAAISVMSYQSARLLAMYLPALYQKVVGVHMKTA